MQITGDYVDDFKFIYSIKDEDCEKPVHQTSRDLRHEKFRNQVNSFENFDSSKELQSSSESSTIFFVSTGLA